MGINKKIKVIYADNFRGFSDAFIPFKQVNFLVGENSSGKTSILSLISLFSSKEFWLQGEINSNETIWESFEEAVSASSKNKKYFTIGYGAIGEKVESDEAQENSSDPRVHYSNASLFTFEDRDGKLGLKRFSYLNRNNVCTIRFTKKYIYFNELECKSEIQADSELLECLKKVTVIDKQSTGGKRKARGEKDLRMYDSEFPYMMLPYLFEDFRNKDPDKNYGNFVDPFSDSLVWLAPIRTSPKRTYDGVEKSYSSDGKHIPHLLKKILTDADKKKSFERSINRFGRESHLFSSIGVKSHGSNKNAPFEVTVELGGCSLSINNIGYGVSQSLPIIVETITSKNESLLCIQQPEVHLHPKAQAALGALTFLTAKNDNKSYIIETHSDFMIDRFRSAIRKNKGELSESSQVIFFERRLGKNIASPISISEKGELDQNQPSNYRKFFINEEMDILGF